MTADERKQYLKTPVDLVCVRTFKGRTKADAKLEEFEVGQEISMTHEFADEAISLGKVVVKGSAQHKTWVEAEGKKKKAKAATANPSLQESIGELVGKIGELVDALKKK